MEDTEELSCFSFDPWFLDGATEVGKVWENSE